MADVDELEDDVGAGEFQASPGGGLNKLVKILIYVALGAVGIVLMAVIAFYVATFAAKKQYKDVASIVVMKPPPPRDSFRFNSDFRVNTADVSSTHFIKLKLSLGFEEGNAALSGELAKRTDQLRNVINLILGGKMKGDLNSVRKQLELREEIKASINHLLSNGKIEEVNFLEFIVN